MFDYRPDIDLWLFTQQLTAEERRWVAGSTEFELPGGEKIFCPNSFLAWRCEKFGNKFSFLLASREEPMLITPYDVKKIDQLFDDKLPNGDPDPIYKIYLKGLVNQKLILEPDERRHVFSLMILADYYQDRPALNSYAQQALELVKTFGYAEIEELKQIGQLVEYNFYHFASRANKYVTALCKMVIDKKMQFNLFDDTELKSLQQIIEGKFLGGKKLLLQDRMDLYMRYDITPKERKLVVVTRSFDECLPKRVVFTGKGLIVETAQLRAAGTSTPLNRASFGLFGIGTPFNPGAVVAKNYANQVAQSAKSAAENGKKIPPYPLHDGDRKLVLEVEKQAGQAVQLLNTIVELARPTVGAGAAGDATDEGKSAKIAELTQTLVHLASSVDEHAKQLQRRWGDPRPGAASYDSDSDREEKIVTLYSPCFENRGLMHEDETEN